MIVGNDCSAYQGDIDFDTYKQNTNFVIIKATEGNGYTDTKFSRNQSEARRTGIPLGYYHFARPDLNNSFQDEALYFLQRLGTLQEGEVLCLDYEANWKGDVVAWCNGFLDFVFHATGVRPLIYLNKTQVKSYDWHSIVDGGYGLWLACYDDNVIAGQWAGIAMQQWTNKQTVPGIVGNVDGDRFFGTIDQFKAYGYHKPPTPTTPPAGNSLSDDEKAALAVLHDVVATVKNPTDPTKMMFNKLESAARWIPDAVTQLATYQATPVFKSQLAQLLYKAAQALG